MIEMPHLELSTSPSLYAYRTMCRLSVVFWPEYIGQYSKVVLDSRWIKECLESFILGNTESPQMETSQNGRENQMKNSSKVNLRTIVVNNALCKNHKSMKCTFQVCR